jgi:hypothetical protein
MSYDFGLVLYLTAWAVYIHEAKETEEPTAAQILETEQVKVTNGARARYSLFVLTWILFLDPSVCNSTT